MENKNGCLIAFVWIMALNLVFPLVAARGANETKQAAQGLTISSIEPQGNRSITQNQIFSKIRSRVGEAFDDTTAAQDAKRIAELAGVEQSYYNTTVTDNNVKLVFVIIEKNIVRSISFAGNKVYKSEKLKKQLDLKRGDYLDMVAADTSVKKLLDYYHNKGYPFAEASVDRQRFALGELNYTINEGPRVKVAAVAFTGNNSIKSSKLQAAMKMKKRKFLILQGYYIEENIDKDIEKLRSIYYDRGHLNVTITAKKDFSPDRSKVKITYEISEGPVYTVGEIVFTGNKYFAENRLRAELKLKQGQVYNEFYAESDSKRILKLYREIGFINAMVYRKRNFVGQNQVQIEYDIKEDERFRIGMINITGNERVQDKVVRRVLDEYDFQPGNWYNGDYARGDGTGLLEKMVRQETMSESAAITPTGKNPGVRDAQVSVAEGQTGFVMLGAGVGSDSGVIGQLVFEQRNFDISDTPESFEDLISGRAFKGAGQTLRIALQPGTEVSEYSVSFTEPYLNNKPISLDVVGSSYERFQESYDEQRTKGFVGFEKRYKDFWRRSLGFRLENVNISDIDDDAPQEIKDVEGDNALAGVKFGVGRNLVDDKFDPSKGYIFNVGYEQVGGDYTFGILSAAFKNYTTIYEDLAERKTVLGTKLLAATTVGDAPPFEKFYGGGTGTYGIRGFEYRGVSTRGLQTNVLNPERKDPIGSDWIFLANTEVVVPMVSNTLSGLFFIDTGTVDTGNYRAAIGTGIQIKLPQWFGPVPMRFELAVPFLKDEDDDTQIFSFSVGRLF